MEYTKVVILKRGVHTDILFACTVASLLPSQCPQRKLTDFAIKEYLRDFIDNQTAVLLCYFSDRGVLRVI